MKPTDHMNTVFAAVGLGIAVMALLLCGLADWAWWALVMASPALGLSLAILLVAYEIRFLGRRP